MDHFIPKRRVPVTLWSAGMDAVSAQLFLDLDPASRNHQTLLEKLDESTPFLPAVVGGEGRIPLFHKQRLLRVSPGKSVLLADVFSRGIQPWREEDAEVTLVDGVTLAGRVWMPVARESQRLSDYMNEVHGFVVLLAGSGAHLLNPAAIAGMLLSESAGVPLSTGPDGDSPGR